MQYGQKKTSIILVDHIFKGEIDKTIVQYTTRIAVEDVQNETSEFLKFSDMLRELREKGTLTWDKTDKTTLPSFTIHYPKEDAGSYFVILNWCESIVQSEVDKVTE